MKKAASQAANKGAAKPPSFIKIGAVLIVAWPRNFIKIAAVFDGINTK